MRMRRRKLITVHTPHIVDVYDAGYVQRMSAGGLKYERTDSKLDSRGRIIAGNLSI